MPNVTIHAGSGNAVLTYNVADRAYTAAQQLGQLINTAFGTGTSYPNSGSYVYDIAATPTLNVDNSSDRAVVIRNSGVANVVGGGQTLQTVLLSNGGVNFTDNDGNSDHIELITAGASTIPGVVSTFNFAGNNGGVALLTDGGGKDAVTLGGGLSDLSAGGADTITLGAGTSIIDTDTTSGGTALINFTKGAGAVFLGSSTVQVASNLGNATLTSYSTDTYGADTLSFVNETKGAFTVTGYNSHDLLSFTAAQKGAGYGVTTVSGGGSANTVITLGDSTKITLIGYTGTINHN